MGTAGAIQVSQEFEFPAKIVFANILMIIDLRLRFQVLQLCMYNHINFDLKGVVETFLRSILFKTEPKMYSPNGS